MILYGAFGECDEGKVYVCFSKYEESGNLSLSLE